MLNGLKTIARQVAPLSVVVGTILFSVPQAHAGVVTELHLAHDLYNSQGDAALSVSNGVAIFDINPTYLSGGYDWRIVGFYFNTSSLLDPAQFHITLPNTSLSFVTQMPAADQYSFGLFLDVGAITPASVALLPKSLELQIDNLPLSATESDLFIPNPLIQKAFGLQGEFEVGLWGFDPDPSCTRSCVRFTILDTGLPEPWTLSIFGAGFVGAVAMRRKKRPA